MLAVELEGHAAGQIGLLLGGPLHPTHFLVADACWTLHALQERRPPSRMVDLLLANADTHPYRVTLDRLYRFARERQDVKIVPCHCADTVAGLCEAAP